MQERSIAVIGAGYVGATIAYALALKNLGEEILLIDSNKEKADGEVFDLSDALAGISNSRVRSGSYLEAAQADVIIISAGLPRRPEQSRRDIIEVNRAVMDSIFHEMGPLKPNAMILVVTNPVDILTQYVQQISGLPYSQVIGSGTLLDSMRLHNLLAQHLSANVQDVTGYFLGEHGTSGFVAWSTVRVQGALVRDLTSLDKEAKGEIEEQVRKRGQTIISKKGATNYGIASAVGEIVESILQDQKMILPISTYIEQWQSLSSIYLGFPAMIGARGVEKLVPPDLIQEELISLEQSAIELKQLL